MSEEAKNKAIEKNLQMSLKTKWFEMTKDGIKTEDYREITPYWAKRLFLYQGEPLKNNLDDLEIEIICEELNNAINCFGELDEEIAFVFDNWYLTFKNFDFNIMTLGYPKSTDADRILKLEHKGIEIRTGNPDWGAEPNKLYFIIKHGQIKSI